jgi:hypothetical protein
MGIALYVCKKSYELHVQMRVVRYANFLSLDTDRHLLRIRTHHNVGFMHPATARFYLLQNLKCVACVLVICVTLKRHILFTTVIVGPTRPGFDSVTAYRPGPAIRATIRLYCLSGFLVFLPYAWQSVEE